MRSISIENLSSKSFQRVISTSMISYYLTKRSRKRKRPTLDSGPKTKSLNSITIWKANTKINSILKVSMSSMVHKSSSDTLNLKNISAVYSKLLTSAKEHLN